MRPKPFAPTGRSPESVLPLVFLRLRIARGSQVPVNSWQTVRIIIGPSHSSVFRLAWCLLESTHSAMWAAFELSDMRPRPLEESAKFGKIRNERNDFDRASHATDRRRQALCCLFGKAGETTSIIERDSARGGSRADVWHADGTFLAAYPKLAVPAPALPKGNPRHIRARAQVRVMRGTCRRKRAVRPPRVAEYALRMSR
ncbi:hypothetical protein ABIC03_007643 [Bradyrhizobium sp. RT6a]